MFFFDAGAPFSSLFGDTSRRAVSSSFRMDTMADNSGEVVLVFVDITHPNLNQVIRVVSEGDGGVSYANGKTVNYRYGGDLYLGAPFQLALLSDGDRPAETSVTVPNIDAALSDEIQSLSGPPQVRIRLIKASDFDELHDIDNARNPLAAPVVELDADYLFLRNIQGDLMQITGSLSTYDLGNEPYPPIRTVKSKTPGLYK